MPGPSRPTGVPALPDGDLIVFDGLCVVCSGFARLVVRADPEARFRCVTAQSDLGRSLYLRHGLDPDLMETNIVIVGGRAHVRMGAFAAAMGRLGWPWRVLAVVGVIPRPLADPLYRLIARTRYGWGRRACPLPSADLRGRLVG